MNDDDDDEETHEGKSPLTEYNEKNDWERRGRNRAGWTNI